MKRVLSIADGHRSKTILRGLGAGYALVHATGAVPRAGDTDVKVEHDSQTRHRRSGRWCGFCRGTGRRG
ncbi:hypothetical protein I553_6322 [Mycobacterium xenopi 4042]|uniref:Uncharacterized protein n=1 Tax=Mycobacterium xenopi 4042 TaxID=1299334 RepID=X8BEA6_MYCXE|nr:hypothetical protein I553_6322 [Mycobacterium xenopi 4042]